MHPYIELLGPRLISFTNTALLISLSYRYFGDNLHWNPFFPFGSDRTDKMTLFLGLGVAPYIVRRLILEKLQRAEQSSETISIEALNIAEYGSIALPACFIAYYYISLIPILTFNRYIPSSSIRWSHIILQAASLEALSCGFLYIFLPYCSKEFDVPTLEDGALTSRAIRAFIENQNPTPPSYDLSRLPQWLQQHLQEDRHAYEHFERVGLHDYLTGYVGILEFPLDIDTSILTPEEVEAVDRERRERIEEIRNILEPPVLPDYESIMPS